MDERCAELGLRPRADATCDADHPGDIPERGWFDVLTRLAQSLGRDGMRLRAAGVACCWLSSPWF
jgi:membrane protein